MKVAELTIQQQRKLMNQVVKDELTFHPITMPNGRFFISEEEINLYEGQEFAFIKDLPLIDFDPTIPDTTPPTPMGMGVMIPSDYPVLKLFKNLVFKMHGFEVPIVEVNGGYAVDLAYILWPEFRAEQDYLYNIVTFEVFETLWGELKAAAENQEFVSL